MPAAQRSSACWVISRDASVAARLPAHTRPVISPSPAPTAAAGLTPNRSSAPSVRTDVASAAASAAGTPFPPGNSSATRPPAPQDRYTPPSRVTGPAAPR